jgi:hypothetical protein
MTGVGEQGIDPGVLRLDLGIEDVTLGRLIEAQERFLGVIREVTRDVVGSPGGVRWLVEDIETNSLDLVLRPEPARASVAQALMAELVGTIARGIRTLEEEAHRPPHFNDAALGQARDLARLRGRGITKIEVRAADIETRVTTRTVANIEDVVGRTITAIGTVEGRLEAINVHGDRVFYVWDPITRRRIRCDFGHRIPSTEVGRAVERRVAVTGELRYKENGTLIEIRADELTVLEEADQLPTADDVRGILAARA